MRVSKPITVVLPGHGVLFAESAHANDFMMPERADPYHKLIYVLAGKVAYRESNEASARVFGAGTVLVVPRGVRHVINDHEPSTLLLLCIGGEFLETDGELGQLWLALTRSHGRKLALSRPTRQVLEDRWRRAMMEGRPGRLGGGVVVRATAAQVLVTLARLPPEGAGALATERVKAVKHEVEETFYEEWDMDRAAARAGLSRRRFSELFREEAGKTFWEYLNDLRMAHAALLLRSHEHSVLGVMFACGFNDLSHFYRMFRKYHGAAPRAWQMTGGVSQKAKRK